MVKVTTGTGSEAVTKLVMADAPPSDGSEETRILVHIPSGVLPVETGHQFAEFLIRQSSQLVAIPAPVYVEIKIG